jgi:hypothetical protein
MGDRVVGIAVTQLHGPCGAVTGTDEKLPQYAKDLETQVFSAD